MGKSSLIFLLLVLALGCGKDESTVATPPADPIGKLQLSETFFDFGKVPIGQKVEHGFELRNAGTAPVLLGAIEVQLLEGC